MGNLNVIFVVILVGGWLGGWELAPLLRSTALIMILLRAGLGVRRSALARSGPTAAMHAFVPCALKGSALTAILHILWGFSLFEAGAAAFMLTAVSPAVAVPSMLNVDGAGLLLLPLGLAGGIGLGAAIGFGLAAWLTRHFDRIRATEKSLVLIGAAVDPLHALSVGLAGVATITAGLANGESILSLAVLAILFTAPLGLLGIRILGPRLLDVTLPPDDEDD